MAETAVEAVAPSFTLMSEIAARTGGWSPEVTKIVKLLVSERLPAVAVTLDG